jgi:hypothetical protein
VRVVKRAGIAGGLDRKVVKRTIRDVGADEIARKRAPVAGKRALRGRKDTFPVGNAPPQVVPARLPELRSKASAGNGEVTSEKASALAIAARFPGSTDGPPARPSGFTDDKAGFITQPASFPARFGRFLPDFGRQPTQLGRLPAQPARLITFNPSTSSGFAADASHQKPGGVSAMFRAREGSRAARRDRIVARGAAREHDDARAGTARRAG